MEESEKNDKVDNVEMDDMGTKEENKFGLRMLGKRGWKTAVLRTILSIFVFCFFIYFFLLNLSLLSAGVKILFAPHAHAILKNENYEILQNSSTNLTQSTVNPILGFFLGDLSAALLQSSSATTSIVVSMVAEDGISVKAAFPVIMGANVGTTVTSTIVSMALFSERKSLRRAFMAATMHDMFNIFTSLVVLPLDWLSGGAMELMTRKMVGINDEHIEAKYYTLTYTGRELLQNNTKGYEDTSDMSKIKTDTSNASEDTNNSTEVMNTIEDNIETTTNIFLGSPSISESISIELSAEEKLDIIENVTALNPDTKDKIKKLVQGKDNGIFYENEKESIEEVLKAFGIAAGIGLGARSGFGDGEEISLRFGEIFEENHNPQLHENPISKITRPLTTYIIQLNDYDTWIVTKQSVRNCTISECHPQSFLFQNWYLQGYNDFWLGIILLVVSTISIVLSIFLISRFFKCITDMDNIEQKWEKYQLNIGTSKHRELYGYLLMLLGMLVSAVIQSSSAFTSMLVPLAANQIICLDCTYALTLGGNIGTTTTSLITALSQDPKDVKEALQIFLSHFFFNIVGIIMFYPVKKFRIPIKVAKSLGEIVAVHKWFGLVYVLMTFLILPLAAIGLSFAGMTAYTAVCIISIAFILLVVIINKLQGYKNGKFLPCSFLMTWNFLPLWMHSLEPYDHLIQKFSFLRRHCEGEAGSDDDITRPGDGSGMLNTFRRSIAQRKSRYEKDMKEV